MRHPDFQPNNILISESNEIVGFIDWQHCSILPLGLAAGIPKHFQNYGDPDSEELKEPQLDLPPNFDSLSPSEQASVRETQQKRLVHFLYAAFTRRLNEEHYDAIFDNSVILNQRLFKSAGTPWEGLGYPTSRYDLRSTKLAGFDSNRFYVVYPSITFSSYPLLRQSCTRYH